MCRHDDATPQDHLPSRRRGPSFSTFRTYTLWLFLETDLYVELTRSGKARRSVDEVNRTLTKLLLPQGFKVEHERWDRKARRHDADEELVATSGRRRDTGPRCYRGARAAGPFCGARATFQRMSFSATRFMGWYRGWIYNLKVRRAM